MSSVNGNLSMCVHWVDVVPRLLDSSDAHPIQSDDDYDNNNRILTVLTAQGVGQRSKYVMHQCRRCPCVGAPMRRLLQISLNRWRSSAASISSTEDLMCFRCKYIDRLSLSTSIYTSYHPFARLSPVLCYFASKCKALHAK